MSTPTLPAPLVPYPDASTTGALLPPLTNVTGDLATTKDGQIIDRTKIGGELIVKHAGVRFLNSYAERGIDAMAGKPDTQCWQSTVGTPQGAAVGAGVKGSHITLRRMNIFGIIDGWRAYSGFDIRDSWVHDLFRTTDSAQSSGMTHNDGGQCSAGSSITVKHNRIDCWTFEKGQTAGKQDRTKSYPQTSALGFYAGGGNITTVLFDDNVVRGRAYGYIYAVSKPGLGTCSGFTIINNWMGSEVAVKDWFKTNTCQHLTQKNNNPWKGQ
jgi:hypothetical protein